MELFTPWFNKKLPLSVLKEQCPFVDAYKSDYVKCFHNVHKIQEFDWMRYIKDHPDLQNMNIRDELSAYNKWIAGGRKGAFILETNKVYNGFLWSEYLQLHPDLGKHGIRSELEAMQHWINHGRGEKRNVAQEMALISESVRDSFIWKLMRACVTETEIVNEFDWKKYLAKYSDVVKAGFNDEKRAYEHWALHGCNENRAAYVLGSNEKYRGFPWSNYLVKNTGLKHLSTELQCYNHWVDFGRKEGRKCWEVAYTVVKKCDIFKLTEFNEALLNTLRMCIQCNVYHPGINISIMDATMQRILNYEKNSIFMCKNKKIVMVMASRLDITAGDTIMCANWMNKLMKENNHITLFSIYQIGPTFTRNLIYNNYICKTLNDNALLMKELDNIIQNIDLALVRNLELLPSLKTKNYLHKIILYGLDQHLDGIVDMNNKFHTVITQSEQLKSKYVKKGVLSNKIEVVAPFSHKYDFQLPNRTDNEIRLIYCGTLRDEENILEIIEDFTKIHADQPNIILKVVYGKIHGNEQFTQKVNNYIQNGVKGVTFKHNLNHRDACYEIATSDIGICWRKKGWGDNGEKSTKIKEYALYDKRICDISPRLFNFWLANVAGNNCNVDKYEFQLPERKDNEIRLIYCGTLCDEENTLEIMDEFQKIHAERPEVVLKIVYDKIYGNGQFTQKVTNYIQNGVVGITFKHNLSHKDCCYEIATSDIGICWRKNVSDNNEVSTKVKVYETYALQICNNIHFLKSVKLFNVAVILDEFSFNAMSGLYNINIHQIIRSNVLDVFKTNYIRYFFCESAWCGKNNTWKGCVYQSTTFARDNIKDLRLVLKYCNEHHIKTIFCNKEDPAHYEDKVHNFVKTSMLFDKIYTTSESCIARYKADYKRDVSTFNFCYNPKSFNPIKKYNVIDDKITFLGSWYSYFVQRCKDMTNIFDNIINNKANIIVYDRFYNTSDSNHKYPTKYKNFITNNVDVNDIADIMKRSKYSLTINSVQDCESMFARRIHEINACNVLCLSNYSKGIDKLFCDTVPFIETANILKITLQHSEQYYELLKLINLHKSFRFTNNVVFSNVFELGRKYEVDKYIICNNADNFTIIEYNSVQSIQHIDFKRNKYKFVSKFPQSDELINIYITHYEYIDHTYILCIHDGDEINYSFDDKHIFNTKNQYIIPPHHVNNKEDTAAVYYVPNICLLNIIIPCFNAENKYTNLINSLVKVKLNPMFFNIMFIDDCSTDNTFNKLNGLDISNKILIRLTSNSGSPSKPRNIGIKCSNSKLILFIDIDDEIVPNMINEKMLLECIDNGYDIVRFPILKRVTENAPIKDLKLMNIIDESGNIGDNLIRQQSTTIDGFYNLSFLKSNNIYFNESIRMSEDTLFIMEIYNKTTKIHYINKPIYIYNAFIQDVGNLSSTQKYEDREIIDHMTVIKMMGGINTKWCMLRLPTFIRCSIEAIIFRCRKIEETTFNIMKETYIKYINYQTLNFTKRISDIINVIMKGTYVEFLEIKKPRLLVSGFDMKFIREIMDKSLSTQYTIKYDKWDGHDEKNFKIKNEVNAELKTNLEWADIIWCEWMLNNAVYYSKLKSARQKLFIRCHRFELTRNDYKNININNVDRIICVSPYYSRLCHEITMFDKSKITTIANYINTKEYEYSTEVYYTIAIVGILPIKKNLFKALEILNMVKQKMPNIKLNIYGSQYIEMSWLKNDLDTINYFRSCEKYVTDNKLNVEYKGFQNMKTELKKNDFVLSVSEKEKMFESFHIAPAEGFVCGCISLFTDWYGCDEIYPSEYIFQDIKLISNYIINFYENNANKPRLNKPGCDHIKRYFDMEIIAQKINNLFLC